MKRFNLKTVILGFVSGLILWVAAAFYDYILFYDDIINSLFMPHISDLYYRLSIVFITTLSGYLIGRYQLQVQSLKDEVVAEKRQREDAEYSLKTETVIDEESGLYTQSAVIKFIEHEINQFKRFETDLSVVMLEIDGLSEFLKKQSTAEVEKLKHEISLIVKNTIRCSDMAGHWGNNNYVLATVKTSEKQAQLVEQKIHKNMSDLMKEYNGKLRIVTGVTRLEKSDSPMDFLNKIASSSVAA